ncbi:hypothetical protein Hanom_Chr15g01402451 [Helianthus anomalus]
MLKVLDAIVLSATDLLILVTGNTGICIMFLHCSMNSNTGWVGLQRCKEKPFVRNDDSSSFQEMITKTNHYVEFNNNFKKTLHKF